MKNCVIDITKAIITMVITVVMINNPTEEMVGLLPIVFIIGMVVSSLYLRSALRAGDKAWKKFLRREGLIR